MDRNQALQHAGAARRLAPFLIGFCLVSLSGCGPLDEVQSYPWYGKVLLLVFMPLSVYGIYHALVRSWNGQLLLPSLPGLAFGLSLIAAFVLPPPVDGAR